jgi:hypothetical protein
VKGKAIPLQAWKGPEGSRRLRLPDLKQSAHEGGKVVSPMHRPPLLPRNYSWYSFVLRARGGAVIGARRYTPEGRGIDSQWCHWNFLLT